MVRFAIISVFAISLAGSVLAGEVTNPVPATAKSVEAGRQLFQKYCKGCHGESATGDGPQAPKDIHPPNLTDAEWKHGGADADIFTTIRDGVGPKFDMKSWKSRMTEADIWNVVNYLRSIGPKPAAQ
jgi:cbb3-type cytochrome c oxidase subunit III